MPTKGYSGGSEWLDHYFILGLYDPIGDFGLGPKATKEKIKKAWISELERWHPDNFERETPQWESADERTQLINGAYQVLSDKDQKEEYDQAWHAYHREQQKQSPGNTSNASGARPKQKAENNAGSKDQLIQRLRQQDRQRWEQDATRRQKDFALQKKRKNAAQKAIAEKLKASEKKGFLGKLGGALGKVACAVGAHRGEWFYDDVDLCNQSMICEKCGKTFTQVDHTWLEPNRIVDTQCEFILFCDRCGKEEIEFQHVWEWKYVYPNECEQQQKCMHCQELSLEKRINHEWGSWSESAFESASVRTCKRCREQETRKQGSDQNDMYAGTPATTFGSDRVYATNRPTVSLAGIWVVAPYDYPVKIDQSGRQISIQGMRPPVFVSGYGLVNAGEIEISYEARGLVTVSVFAKGILILSADGKQMAGNFYFHYGTVEYQIWRKV